MTYVLTFLEGVMTFVSPCLLPLLPVFLAYFAGGVQEDGKANARAALVGALCFALGFGLLFTLMGAFAGTVGSYLVAYRSVLDAVCGCLLVLLGLNYLDVLHISVFDRAGRTAATGTHGPAGSFMFGLAFAVCWTPCVGTFLASALSLAASSTSAATGVALLASYSLGLGLPFVISAMLIDQLQGAFAWVKQHYLVINRICGILLVVEGALLATGMLGSWMTALA